MNPTIITSPTPRRHRLEREHKSIQNVIALLSLQLPDKTSKSHHPTHEDVYRSWRDTIHITHPVKILTVIPR